MGKKLDFKDYPNSVQNKLEKDMIGKTGHSDTALFKKVTSKATLKKI